MRRPGRQLTTPHPPIPVVPKTTLKSIPPLFCPQPVQRNIDKAERACLRQVPLWLHNHPHVAHSPKAPAPASLLSCMLLLSPDPFDPASCATSVTLPQLPNPWPSSSSPTLPTPCNPPPKQALLPVYWQYLRTPHSAQLCMLCLLCPSLHDANSMENAYIHGQHRTTN